MLGDVTAVGLQKLQHTGGDVSAAEVIRAQRREEHTLGLSPHLHTHTHTHTHTHFIRDTQDTEPSSAHGRLTDPNENEHAVRRTSQ